MYNTVSDPEHLKTISKGHVVWSKQMYVPAVDAFKRQSITEKGSKEEYLGAST